MIVVTDVLGDGPAIPANIIRLALVFAQKQLTKAADITGTSHFMGTFKGSIGQYKKGTNHVGTV